MANAVIKNEATLVILIVFIKIQQIITLQIELTLIYNIPVLIDLNFYYQAFLPHDVLL